MYSAIVYYPSSHTMFDQYNKIVQDSVALYDDTEKVHEVSSVSSLFFETVNFQNYTVSEVININYDISTSIANLTLLAQWAAYGQQLQWVSMFLVPKVQTELGYPRLDPSLGM